MPSSGLPVKSLRPTDTAFVSQITDLSQTTVYGVCGAS